MVILIVMVMIKLTTMTIEWKKLMLYLFMKNKVMLTNLVIFFGIVDTIGTL